MPGRLKNVHNRVSTLASTTVMRTMARMSLIYILLRDRLQKLDCIMMTKGVRSN